MLLPAVPKLLGARGATRPPHRELASPHQDLVSFHRDLSVLPLRFSAPQQKESVLDQSVLDV